MSAEVFYASGRAGPQIRADGSGGSLARGYYRRSDGARIGDAQGLTKTQRIILLTARDAPGGTVEFARGDRKGTRIASRDAMGVPLVVAYSNPEYFLKTRGLLAAGNAPHTYRITDLGRAVLATVLGSHDDSNDWYSAPQTEEMRRAAIAEESQS